MLVTHARAWISVSVLAGGLALASGACVSPDVFSRDGGGLPGDGEGGAPGPGTGGSTNNGSGGSSNGAGGHIVTTGAGGTVVTGAGGRTGAGGTTGSGGAGVIGPTANLMDGFETGDVTQRWIAPQSSDSPPCGTWAVVADGATNHVYAQTSTACTSSNPSWAAGGDISWTDMRLQVRVRFDSSATSSTKITIAVRYNDSKDMYFIEYTNDGKMKIRERSASSTSDVVSLASKMAVPVPNGTWSTIGLSIKGGTINGYIGTDPTAAPVLTGTASGQTAGGIAIGVSAGTASFDDVLVTAP
jgi:hypothetical protein